MLNAHDVRRGIERAVNDQYVVTIWIALVLTSATLLILFAHQYIEPQIVFNGMILMVIVPVVAHISNMNNRWPPTGGGRHP